MPRCPECGGELKFDRSKYLYVCRGCGLSLNRSEYEKLEFGKRPSEEEDERERMKKEYLKWWLRGDKF